MNFRDILTNIRKSTKPSKPVDAYAMVNGQPSNDVICEGMLEGEQESPEVLAYLQSLGQELGFSEAETKLFWGNV
jgi:hypothetical protein